MVFIPAGNEPDRWLLADIWRLPRGFDFIRVWIETVGD